MNSTAAHMPASAVLLQRAQGTPDVSYLGYVPLEALNIVGAVVYYSIAIGLSCRQTKLWTRHMLPMTIGAWAFSIGILLRFPIRSRLDGLLNYLSQELCILLSICWIMASLYTILGEIAFRYETHDCFFIPDSWFTKVSLVVTFVSAVLQAVGTGLETRGDTQMVATGTEILLAGHVVQLISFLIFCGILLGFLFRMRTQHFKSFNEANRLLVALAVTSSGILIRSVFRVIQAAQGPTGMLSTNEFWFWIFDALPIAVGLISCIVYWPECYLPPISDVENRGHIPLVPCSYPATPFNRSLEHQPLPSSLPPLPSSSS